MISVLWQNKAKSKKIAELESSLMQLKACSGVDTSSQCNAMTSSAAACVQCPSRDEYSKATQTLETAFVPCEGCHLVQQCLRDAASTIVTTCDNLSLTSHLAQHQKTVSGVHWLSGTS